MPARCCAMWLAAVPHILLRIRDAELSAAEQRAFEALVARRAAGEPVAYLTGEREFFSLRLQR